eukprot:6550732-Alexandrium_andersonii.AAC.1
MVASTSRHHSGQFSTRLSSADTVRCSTDGGGGGGAGTASRAPSGGELATDNASVSKEAVLASTECPGNVSRDPWLCWGGA